MGALLRHKRLAGFVILLAFFATIPAWVDSPYYIDLFIAVLINGALGMTFVMMLRTGLISLCIAAFWGMGAYASVLLVTKGGLSFWAALPLSMLITAAAALVIGRVIIRHAGFTFIIMTTVIGMLFVTVVGNIKWMGGYQGISSVPPPDPIGPIVFDSKVDFFYLGLVLFVIVALVVNALYASWAGRAWNAIGLNPRLAQSMGVNVLRYRIFSFVVACAIAGLMGSFYAHYQAYINPAAFNLFPKTIYIQAFAVLGGVGYATLGPIVGAALLTFFTELVSDYNVWSIIMVGAMVVIVVIFLPNGVLSLFEYPAKFLAWRRRPRGPEADGEGMDENVPATHETVSTAAAVGEDEGG